MVRAQQLFVAEHGIDVSVCHDPSGVDDDGALAKLPRIGQVVGHHHQRLVESGEDLSELAA